MGEYERQQKRCKRGHYFDPSNTYIDKRGFRSCKQCKRDWMLQHSRDQRLQENQTLIGYVERPAPRELDVWSGIAAGLSNPEISVRLNITVPSVENYINSLLKKLQCENRVQLARKHWLNQPNIRM